MTTSPDGVYRRCRMIVGGALLLLLPWYAAASEMPPLSTGQAVYVPVYSSVLYGNINSDGKPSEMLLSAMLSVRNTDPKHAITLTSVKYYDTEGRMLREHIAAPAQLPPMGTRDFFVEYRERSGGTGANFMVTWKSEHRVNQPIMETLQVYHAGAQSQSFISRGQVIDPHGTP